MTKRIFALRASSQLFSRLFIYDLHFDAPVTENVHTWEPNRISQYILAYWTSQLITNKLVLWFCKFYRCTSLQSVAHAIFVHQDGRVVMIIVREYHGLLLLLVLDTFRSFFGASVASVLIENVIKFYVSILLQLNTFFEFVNI